MNSFKKWLPDRAAMQKKRRIKGLEFLSKYEVLWELNRYSVANGVAIGLFVLFIPIPLQMLWAGLFAWLLRGNLPIAVAISWINNPFTFLAINFGIYQVGAWILAENNTFFANFPVWHWESISVFGREFLAWFLIFGKAYVVGWLIISFGSAILGYLLVQIGWSLAIFWRRKEVRDQ